MDIVLRIKATTTTVEILTESLGPGVTPLSLEKDGNSALYQNVPNYQEQVKPIHIIHNYTYMGFFILSSQRTVLWGNGLNGKTAQSFAMEEIRGATGG